MIRAVPYLLLTLLLAACGAAATPTPTAEPTATPVPATATPREQTAAERGLVLFTTMQQEAGFACITCHYPYSDDRLIGPGLQSLAERVPEYNPDASIEDYLRNAILAPDEFIVPGTPAYPPHVMPAKYAQIFTDEQLDDLVAFLMSL
jgi:mono/diheme cytochrome c family protein